MKLTSIVIVFQNSNLLNSKWSFSITYVMEKLHFEFNKFEFFCKFPFKNFNGGENREEPIFFLKKTIEILLSE